MGGKTASSSSQIQIPPDVLARYNSVNARAETAAATPFQEYSKDPSAFVAPMNSTQNAAVGGINDAQGMYKPYFDSASTALGGANTAANSAYDAAGGMYNSALDQEQGYQAAAGVINHDALGQLNSGLGAAGAINNSAYGNINSALGDASAQTGAALNTGKQYLGGATDYALRGGQSVDPTALGAAQIGQFMSPYNDAVVNSTMANLRQQQGQEQSQLQGDQIMRGSFGGSRSALGAANLARQQDLASGQVLSGLMNQNYSQALGAAQQQQGVGLGAAQANRAATQQTGQSLASLGSQGYSQQMGTAAQQAALAGQGFSAAGSTADRTAALAGQGFAGAGSTADRAAALGQQGFNAMSQTGTNQQGLGAARFGQGIATSQQQAALGSGSQAAELAARQAQLGAGTVGQQTDQAGKQALYNQFLQQQGYPFQVAQFLAGIAEGTGALSGSTTNSTQPVSFLSDGRMKEDIQEIGKTFDGQKIIKFRYKGSKHKEIGLLAQDVEQHHPDAITEHGGLKYVNYDKATTPSAARGHFASGGLAGDGSMSEILRIQKAMFPYGAEGGDRTGGGAGPHGMQLAPSSGHKLLTADAPKISNTNSLHELASAAGDAENLEKAGKGAWDFGKKYFGDKEDDSPEDGSKGLYRGGLVRKRAAGGGTPYKTDDPYVPADATEKPDTEKLLQAAKQDKLKSSGEQTLGDVKDIAKIAAMFMNAGGVAGNRKARAEGGEASDDGTGFGGDNYEANKKSREQSSDFLSGLGRAVKDYGRKAIDYIEHPVESVAVKHDPAYRPKETPQRGASASWAPENPAPALGAAAQPPLVPSSPVQPSSGLGAAAPAPQAAQDGPAPGLAPSPPPEVPSAPATTEAPAGGKRVPPEKRPGWFARNQDWLVPVLKGVGTAAASPSLYLGSALAQGVGAAAGSYEDIQNQLQKREKGAVDIQAGANKLVPTDLQGSMQAAIGPDGKVIRDANNQIMYTALKAPGSADGAAASPAAAGAPQKDRTKAISARYDDSSKRYVFDVGPTQLSDKRMEEAGIKVDPNASPEQRGINARIQLNLTGNGAAAQAAEKSIEPVVNSMRDMDSQHTQLLQMASELDKQPRTGLSAQGAAHETAGQLIKMANWAARSMGVPPPEGLNQSETTDQIVNKLSTWAAARAADNNGLHSMHVAMALQQSLPSGSLSPEASHEMMANLLRVSQQDRDFAEYAREHKNTYGTYFGADGNFKADVQPQLDKDSNTITGLMKLPAPKGVPGSMMSFLIDNRARLDNKDREKLSKAYGPEILRWLNAY